MVSYFIFTLQRISRQSQAIQVPPSGFESTVTVLKLLPFSHAWSFEILELHIFAEYISHKFIENIIYFISLQEYSFLKIIAYKLVSNTVLILSTVLLTSNTVLLEVWISLLCKYFAYNQLLRLRRFMKTSLVEKRIKCVY